MTSQRIGTAPSDIQAVQRLVHWRIDLVVGAGLDELIASLTDTVRYVSRRWTEKESSAPA